MEQHEQYWRDQIKFAHGSGMTMKLWCEQHQVTLGQMKYWLRKLLSKRKHKITSTWLEVPMMASPAASLTIQIGNARIDVTDGFDPMLLKQIVHALEKP